MSGRIISVSPGLREGMFFKKGDILLKIDPRSYEITVKRIRARLAQQKAEIKRIEQETKNQEANLKLAEEELELALRELNRQKNLKATNVASEIAVETAKLKYLESKSRKQTIENTLLVLEPQKESAKAGLNITQAELEEAELNLSKTVIRAPFDGRTAEKYIEEGQFVTVGTPLARVYDTSAIEVPVQLTLEDLGWLDLESILTMGENKSSTALNKENTANESPPVALAHLSFGENNYTWRGFVSRIGGEIERSTRTISVFAEFPNPQKDAPSGGNIFSLIPGMFVQVEFIGRQFSDVYELPRNALRTGDVVYIAQDGKLRMRPVHVLQRIGDKAYVDDGIQPGEQIIISPLSTVLEGMKVRTSASSSK